MQALQYLRKLCSHPLLVLDPRVTQHVSAVGAVAKTGADSWHKPGSALRQLCHAPKLVALRQLLQVRNIQCGCLSNTVLYIGRFRVAFILWVPLQTSYAALSTRILSRTWPQDCVAGQSWVKS